MMSEPAPWVLLRGLAREAGHWGDFAQRLSHGLGGARVIALDLPGCGARRGLRSPANVYAMAADVRARLQALGHAGPANVLALSLGAMVALAWLQSHPHEVARAVLINTSVRGQRPWRRLQLPAAAALLSTLAMPARSAERVVAAFTSAAATPQVVAEWVALRRVRPVTRPDALRQLAAAARFRPAAGAPARPVLLLSSVFDRLVDPVCTRELAARWDAPWAEHRWAGHDLPLDDPAWVVAQVRAWIDAEGKDGGDEGGAETKQGKPKLPL